MDMAELARELEAELKPLVHTSSTDASAALEYTARVLDLASPDMLNAVIMLRELAQAHSTAAELGPDDDEDDDDVSDQVASEEVAALQVLAEDLGKEVVQVQQHLDDALYENAGWNQLITKHRAPLSVLAMRVGVAQREKDEPAADYAQRVLGKLFEGVATRFRWV